MASVFEGRHPILESRVALKLMHPALAADPRAAARFLREAKAAAQLRHQHVVEVFDMGTEASVPFIVMEYLEGSDLAQRVAELGKLPLASIASVFLPIASAIEAAHAAGIIHRDLKPANVMLAHRPPRGRQPVVLDFGISKLNEDPSDVTRSGSVVGTLPYLAPELTNGAQFASPASDQYAFSVMLYECATGRLPFEGDGPYALMHAIVNAELKPPSSLDATLPPEFDALVLRGMHRDRAQRFHSMKELGVALLSFAPRNTFQLWSDEFLRGRISDVDESVPGVDTEADLPRPAPVANDCAQKPAAAGKQPARRGAGAAALLLGLYAAAVTVLLALHPSDVKSSAQRSPASVAAATNASAVTRLTSVRSSVAQPVEQATMESPANGAGGLVASKSPPASAQAALGMPSARPPSNAWVSRAARPVEPRRTHPAAGAHSTSDTDLGTNGALIIE